MALIDPGTVHDAVARLYELARTGEIDNVEFNQLDSLVYDRLVRTYEAMPEFVAQVQASA